ncbi:sporulation protein YpjB [Paraliobacillus salinarum]|uniref:sporulation protein YpjB n=1 Tax=Paraliobacillus salinarum TaxID=1158996 RepID=UPI0015F4170E|nr:sporulation protein YpjB [Paraliobacillus salinarum]
MNRNIISKLYIITMIVVIGWGFVYLSVSNAIESSSVSYSYERYVSEKRYDHAMRWLQDHANEMEELVQTLDTEKQSPINELIRHNLEIVNRDDITHQYKVNHARSLVITVDAIEQSESPLWIKSKQALDKKLETTIQSDDFSQQAIEDLLIHWQMLRPALQITLDEDDFVELDRLFSNLGKESLNIKEDTETVFKYSQLIDIHSPASEADPLTFYWIILMVGGIIIITLSYVAWKKYKAEKKRKQKQPY